MNMIKKLVIYGFFIIFISNIVNIMIEVEGAEQPWTTMANNEQMTDSEFDVIAGHKYVIQTTGKWSCGPHPWDDSVCGYIDANGDNRYAHDTLYPEERVSAIVFTVGPNKIGSGTNVIFTPSQSGRLYSVFNDVPGMFENAGSVTSSIEDISPVTTPFSTDKKETLGPYSGSHKYYIHIYNVDDIAKAIVNREFVKQMTYQQDSGWIEITNYLSSGENIIEFNLENEQYGGWAYGFEIRQDESNIIWTDSCGTSGKMGCMNNDGTQGLVYRYIINLKIDTITESVPISTPIQPKISISNASVTLYGEKTDVELGENVLLKLSAVNLIVKPPMHAQIIIIPPSGWSVVGDEFTKTKGGQYSTDFRLEPGQETNINVVIIPNQVGKFKVEGRIVYYFGENKEDYEDYNEEIELNVRPEEPDTPLPNQQHGIPGFLADTVVIGILLMILFIRKRR